MLNQALWFATEADGKYSTRYRSVGARELDASDWWRHLRHEHVLTRKELVAAMLAAPDQAGEILQSAIACTVTADEHRRLGAVGEDIRGWERYVAAGVDVFDEQAGAFFIKNGQFCDRP